METVLELHPKNWTQFLEVQFFMSKYSKEIKEKVISLFEKELSPFRIAKELEIPESTAYRTKLVGFYADEVRKYLTSSAFYLFLNTLKGGQN